MLRNICFAVLAVFTVCFSLAVFSGCGGGKGTSTSSSTGSETINIANPTCEDETLYVGGKFKIHDTYPIMGDPVPNATVELAVTYTIGTDPREYKSVKTGITGSEGLTDTLKVTLYGNTCTLGKVHIKSSVVWISASGYEEKTQSVPNTDWSGWESIALMPE